MSRSSPRRKPVKEMYIRGRTVPPSRANEPRPELPTCPRAVDSVEIEREALRDSLIVAPSHGLAMVNEQPCVEMALKGRGQS
jgi:hypothetical protein